MRKTPCRRNESACDRSAVPHRRGLSPAGSLALVAGFGLSSYEDAPVSGVRRRDCAGHRRWGLGGGCCARRPGRAFGTRRERRALGGLGAQLDAVRRRAARARTAGREPRRQSVPPGSSAVAFEIGAAGPVALVQSGDDRTVVLVRRARSAGRRSASRRSARSSGSAGPASRSTGGPRGARLHALERPDAEEPAARLARRRQGPHHDAPDHAGGLPEEPRAAAAAPLLFGDVVHVVESYGYRGVLGTIEWFPSKKTWIGLGLDAGLGDYPVGPVFAGLSPNGVMHAAWTESLLSFDLEAAPVTLVERQRFASSEFVLDRALTSALALPVTGPEVAANQWISTNDLGLDGDSNLGRDDRPRPEQGRARRLDLRLCGPRRAAGATCCWAGRKGCGGCTCPGESRRASRSRRRTTASR